MILTLMLYERQKLSQMSHKSLSGAIFRCRRKSPEKVSGGPEKCEKTIEKLEENPRGDFFTFFHKLYFIVTFVVF